MSRVGDVHVLISREASIQNDSERPVRRVLTRFLLAFFCLWLFCLTATLARGKFLLHQSDSTLSLWFDNSNDAHMDLAGFNTKTLRFTNRETGGPVVVYPAPMMTVYMALTRWTADPIALYTVVVSLIALTIALCFAWLIYTVTGTWLVYPAVLATMAFYYPLWFDFERSNVEPMVWLPTSLAALALVLRRYKTAAVFIALAASLKLYPGILFLVFLREKRYRDLALSLMWYIVFTVIGLFSLNSNLIAAWQEVRSGLATLTASHVASFEGPAIGFDHSFFSLVKQAVRMMYPALARNPLKAIDAKIVTAMQIYTPLAALLFFGLFAFFIRKFRVENQVVILLIFCVTLPPISYEYTLLQVYPAFAILLGYICYSSVHRSFLSERWRVALLGSFIAVSLPLPFISGRYAGFGGQVKLLALLIPMIFCFLYPIDFGLEQRSKQGQSPSRQEVAC